MAVQYEQLEQIADTIGNLTQGDLHRLARIIVRHSPMEACEVLDGIQGEFALIEKELEL